LANKKRILIIDDHPLFREGLKSIIARNPGFEVVGDAGNGRKGLRMARELKPDLVVMDISLPDKSGIDITRRIQHFCQFCDTKDKRVSMILFD